MSLDIQGLYNVLENFFEEKNVQVSVVESLKGGLIAATTTTIGGFALGPVGLFFGSLVGGLAAYKTANNFKPINQVINEMNHHQKELLYNQLMDIVNQFSILDAVVLVTTLTANQEFGSLMFKCVTSFLKSNMNVKEVKGNGLMYN